MLWSESLCLISVPTVLVRLDGVGDGPDPREAGAHGEETGGDVQTSGCVVVGSSRHGVKGQSVVGDGGVVSSPAHLPGALEGKGRVPDKSGHSRLLIPALSCLYGMGAPMIEYASF